MSNYKNKQNQPHEQQNHEHITQETTNKTPKLKNYTKPGKYKSIETQNEEDEKRRKANFNNIEL